MNKNDRILDHVSWRHRLGPWHTIGAIALAAVIGGTCGAAASHGRRTESTTVASTTRTRRIELVDGHGKTRALLAVDEDGVVRLRLSDSKGHELVSMEANDRDGTGGVLFKSRTGDSADLGCDPQGAGMNLAMGESEAAIQLTVHGSQSELDLLEGTGHDPSASLSVNGRELAPRK